MITYDLGEGIIAFSTDRTIGRDPEKVTAAVAECIVAERKGTSAECDCGGTAPVPDVESVRKGLRFARPHQTHDDRTVNIAGEFFALPESIQAMVMDGRDAVITNMDNVVLGVSTADCIPVIVFDPVNHAAAAIHAGWRGTVKRIVRKTMEQMRQTFGTDTRQCRAAIGPGISLDSFEVGDEVYNAFAAAGFRMDAAVAVRMPEKWHIDLKEVNRRQLLAEGLQPDNITVCPVDTLTDGRFFSARREQKGDIKCGRNFNGFVLTAGKCSE